MAEEMRNVPIAWDRVWVGADLATMDEAGGIGHVPDAALAIRGGRIAWVGTREQLQAISWSAPVVTEARGLWITPGLIECHTHLVYAGDRSNEFAARLRGATYEDIARAGGGILSTVQATRAASEQQLAREAGARLDAMIAEGVTTVEIKSGYGLDVESELKCLRVARGLARGRNVTITTTVLGAHAVPPEYKGRADEYVDLVCDKLIPRAAEEKLADAVDAFCEGIGFSPAQTRRVFDAARAHGLKIKLHADQLSNLNGAALAAEYGAVSADHLEHTDVAGVKRLKAAGTVAVLLPGAFYFLRETKLPPVVALRTEGVPMAIATDCNPGTSPSTSILTAMNMACTLFRLTPEEALAGVTTHAARALGLQDRGVLEPGKRADFVIWDATEPAELAWTIAGRKPISVIPTPRG